MGRNADWSYQRGRQARFEAEKAVYTGSVSSAEKPALHSRDATMQAMFDKGWHSPTPVEIQQFINPPQSIGEQLRANKRLREILKLGAVECR
ncbi:hypothetical protein [Rheinheimera sp. 4Y26]|uniref:hypothetical protein n=1 Tax=Rheinheimera sp. 4Y26 TaxID=2977811 RepID=UPI0021B154B1|nr:hypothetical protein [Rheinheimera sp. 4Y26]MCT6700904.1 hypothetical protein [Rheinheimera sp. 4Y26]